MAPPNSIPSHADGAYAPDPGQLAGHLLVECLVAQGVPRAFGVPGESYLAVLDGFHAYRDKIGFVINRQEGGAAFMAEAHGKLTGRPGVCFVTRGPGATNASIGVHTAFQDSTPLVLCVGDVASDQRDREAFQEVEYTSFFGPSTKGLAKRVERIDEPDRIPEYVARAFATAINGRPGPVVLVLPEDMLTKTTRARPLPRVEAAQAWPDPGSLARLREMLLAARHTPGGPWARVGRLGGYYNLKYYKGFDELVANTEHIADWVVEQGWPAGKGRCIPNFAATPAAAGGPAGAGQVAPPEVRGATFEKLGDVHAESPPDPLSWGRPLGSR